MSAPAAEVDVPEAPARRSRTWLVLITLVVLVAASGGAWWWLAVEHGDEVADPADGDIVDLGALTTTTGEDQLRHARVSLAVVLAAGVDTEQIEPRVPLLKDALLIEVASMSADELRSRAGSERLRAMLTVHAVEIWGDDVVRRVVLTELMVQ